MSNSQQGEKQQPKRLDGKVKAVLSGDTLVLSHPTKLFPPIEKTLTLVRIQAPRMAKRGESKEEAWAFEAREFLRKKCVGKLVSFQVEYKNATTGRDYGSVFLDGENIGEAILREGLAKFKAQKKESDEYKNLADAQEEAVQKKIGLWSEKKKPERGIIWSGFDADKLLKSFKNKPVNVIVEYVMNGSSFRVQLPTGEMVVLHLTGVQSPGIKVEDKKNEGKKEIGDLWSKEARHYTELRILHRDVTVLFEGIDKGDALLGSVLLSNNENSDEPVTFQEELLMKGFARISEWSAARSKYVSRLRKAETYAKTKKLRTWENYVAPDATLKAEDKGQFNARVVEVISGDTLRIRDEQGKEERISLSSIRAQRFTGQKDSEPWAFEAKDTLRKAVVGKTVSVRVDYRRELKRKVTQTKTVNNQKQQVEVELVEDRRFCTLFINNKVVALDLVKNGYASVIKHKSGEERSIAYDQLMLAELDAKNKKKGLHGHKKNAPIYKFVDITRDTPNQKAQYLNSLKDKKVKGVIEKVFAGTRFRVLLPKEGYYINFAISGVASPSLKPRDEDKPKPFAQEAYDYSVDHLMMRDVDIVVKNMDKSGTFVGDLLVNNDNFALQILKNGYGMLQKIADKLTNADQLKEAERHAREAKLRVWTVDPDVYKTKKQREFEKSAPTTTTTTKFKVVRGQPFLVRVTEVVSAVNFFYQRADSVETIERVDELLSAVNVEELEQATEYAENDVVLALFADDDAWYRGKIVKFSKEKKEARVLYIDYGSTETVPLRSIRVLPKDSELRKIEGTAIEARLAFLRNAPGSHADEAKLLFCDLTSDRDLEASVEFTEGGSQYVTIIDKSDNTNINQTLVRNGLALVDSYYKKFSEFGETIGVYESEQALAKNERYNIWEDGEIFSDDEDDF